MGRLDVQALGRGFACLDTGTHESLLVASHFNETIETRQVFKDVCLEEIAFSQGWIGVEEIRIIAISIKKTSYSQYLLNLIESNYD
jgi:glucose-1-phosphate thymidylyltransferase